MPVWDELGGFFKTMRVYALGKGLLSFAVMGATAVAASFGWGIIVPAIIAIGGGLFSAGMRLHSQALYEDEMTNLYREDIAMHLGIAPNEVTRAHLKIAARENEVIEQALARQRRINIVSFATSALAAAATFGLLMFGFNHAVTKFFTTSFPSLAAANLGFIGLAKHNFAELIQIAAVGIVSGTSSLILHNGLEEAIGHGTGWSKAAAHDLIVAMDRDVKRGRSITPEQVYAVLVAENPTLQQSIATRFNEPFAHMTAREQRATMDTLGVTKDMTEIAEIITQGKVPPGRLAYMIHYSRPTRKIEEAAVEPAPAHGKFVERLGLAPREQGSHVAQVRAIHENAPPSLAAAR